VESDRNPIEILLEIASDESHPVDSRIAAANYAAPYLFPRLSAAVIDARHTVERIDSTDLIARLSDRIARLAPPAPATVITEADAHAAEHNEPEA
jgi:hypothetical protein